MEQFITDDRKLEQFLFAHFIPFERQIKNERGLTAWVYYIDHAGKAISDALTSVKHISRRVADTLYSWRDRFYPCFIDLLHDMEMHPAFDSQVVEILIRLGYFQEFGSSGKLMKLFHEFREGEFKFSKALVPATQEKRLSMIPRVG